jgi:hypothetical protein
MDLKLSVDYYNAAEKTLFQSYPNFAALSGILNREILISEAEFVSYMMFTEQADEDGWRTYPELKDRVQNRLGDIEDILDFSKGSIQSKKSSQRMNASKMTERIGVSLGINVVNKFHGLTEADWAITDDVYIGGKRIKDFDYEIPIASDGTKFIQVENKGAVIDDNSYKTPSVSEHYSSIKAKKNSILAREQAQGIPRHQNVYYGTIGVLDSQNTAKVWLVDPPAFEVEWNPIKFKLISRLIYYSKVFSEIGIHNRFQIALDKRIHQLFTAKDINEFNRVPLDVPLKTYTYIKNNNFVNINNTEAIGTFFFINSNEVFLLALTKVIIRLVLLQNFDGILEYDYKNAELSDKVIIELSAKLSKASEEFEFTKTKFVLDESRKRYFYQAYQEIGFTSSGRIFGKIKN